MREFNSSGLAPSAIVAPSSQVRQAVNPVLQEEVLDIKDTKEYIYYLTHKVNNLQQKDGRIYLRMENGEIRANSVSPYSEKFIDNIEEKIKPLVIALKNKRYLTYSSCMGHGFSFRRYVGLAFSDEETRSYVAQQIKGLNLSGVKTVSFDSVVNSKVTINEKTNKPTFGKYTEEERLAKLNYENEAETFNIQFHRNYERYYFLEIVILDVIKIEKESILKEIKKLGWKLMKIFFWDKLTQKVVDKINSPSFKKYPY
jgi:hypothetical protein